MGKKSEVVEDFGGSVKNLQCQMMRSFSWSCWFFEVGCAWVTSWPLGRPKQFGPEWKFHSLGSCHGGERWKFPSLGSPHRGERWKFPSLGSPHGGKSFCWKFAWGIPSLVEQINLRCGRPTPREAGWIAWIIYEFIAIPSAWGKTQDQCSFLTLDHANSLSSIQLLP